VVPSNIPPERVSSQYSRPRRARQGGNPQGDRGLTSDVLVMPFLARRRI
jgi:hypothetical protein